MAINFLNMLTVNCPTLAETTITFHGTYGYFLILIILVFANIGGWMIAIKMGKHINKTFFAKRGNSE